ncbi:hypothetical protein V8073_004725 [Vibrio parahaemolyticus]
MSKVIRLPEKTYKRLERHSVGFETPAQVIEKMVNYYESMESSDDVQYECLDIDLLEKAFERVFEVKPRKFGQKSSPISGFSDDAKGVQWNISLVAATNNIKLGINLEGMSYSNTWPISRFIENELQTGDLIKRFPLKDVTVRFDRDAWQVSSRLPIEEKTILREKINCISEAQWKESLVAGLNCLDADRKYKGRTKQNVTLIPSGRLLEREVSPHISFKLKLAPQENTLDSLCEAIREGRSKLTSLYDYIKEISS